MNRHNRRSIRLKGYDYGQAGAYFLTLCSQNRNCMFGNITDGKMELSKYGVIVNDEWQQSEQIRKEIKLDEFIIMPNHLHGIVFIENTVGANGRSPLHRMNMGSKTLSSFMAGYKSAVTKQINELCQMPGATAWQRNYYEHIIRNDDDLTRIREYIVNNPVKWEEDDYYVK